jgi:hypothetical protein
VPEFLRSCLAVCCLEQDFPIVFHAPVVAREVLTCGSCLVGSTEVIRKLPDHERLPDGYGCVTINDVQEVTTLGARLGAIVRDPEPIATVAASGRAFARTLQPGAAASGRLERLLRMAARRRVPNRKPSANHKSEDPRFPIAQLAAETLNVPRDPPEEGPEPPNQPIDLSRARAVLRAAERELAAGDTSQRAIGAAIRLEIAIAEAEEAARPAQAPDPLFRLRSHRWALASADLADLVPAREPRLRLLTVDVAGLVDDRHEPAAAAIAMPRLRRVAAFAPVDGARRAPLFISDGTARILELSDGTRSAREIATQIAGHQRGGVRRALRDIEELFVVGFLCFSTDASIMARPAGGIAASRHDHPYSLSSAHICRYRSSQSRDLWSAC